MHETNRNKYTTKQEFNPKLISTPQQDVVSKVEAREKDVTARMQGYKDIIEARKKKNEGDVLSH